MPARWTARRTRGSTQQNGHTMSRTTPTREECVAALRRTAAAVLTRLAVAEAEGRLTESEAAVVARIRSRQEPPVVVPREQALVNARAALDRARAQNAADYAAGRMPAERRAVYERLLARRAEREAAAEQDSP